jgi:hypothetical protein
MTERGNQEAAWVAVVRKLLKVADLAVGSRPRTTRPSVSLATPAAAVPTRFRRAVQAPHLSRGGFFGREAELSDPIVASLRAE